MPVPAPASAPAPRDPSHPHLRWLLLGTMAVWGANLSVVKLLFESLEPMLVAVLRMTVAEVAQQARRFAAAWRALPAA